MSTQAGRGIALVTGASSGIGKATAERLLKDGFAVYVAARRADHMQDLAAKGAVPLKMDITKDEDVRAVVERIIADRGHIDVLVNNAGFGLYGAVEDVPVDEARYQFEVNLFGLGRLTQLVLPHMRSQGSGRIVNVSSMGGKIYTLLGAWYHATKHALEGWSDCLRLEVKPFGIDVVIIEPGVILTEFGDVLDAQLAKHSEHTAYGEMAAALARGTERTYGAGKGSKPSVIANTISRAVRADKPKTRYVAGSMAGPILFLRRWLPDRAFDALILSQTR